MQKYSIWKTRKCFSLYFAKFLRTPFFKEHLRWLLLKRNHSLLFVVWIFNATVSQSIAVCLYQTFVQNLMNMFQPSRGFLKKRRSEIMQQIQSRTPMLKCDFNKVSLQSQFGMGVRTPLIRTPLGNCFLSSLKLQVEIHSSL